MLKKMVDILLADFSNIQIGIGPGLVLTDITCVNQKA